MERLNQIPQKFSRMFTTACGVDPVSVSGNTVWPRLLTVWPRLLLFRLGSLLIGIFWIYWEYLGVEIRKRKAEQAHVNNSSRGKHEIFVIKTSLLAGGAYGLVPVVFHGALVSLAAFSSNPFPILTSCGSKPSSKDSLFWFLSGISHVVSALVCLYINSQHIDLKNDLAGSFAIFISCFIPYNLALCIATSLAWNLSCTAERFRQAEPNIEAFKAVQDTLHQYKSWPHVLRIFSVVVFGNVGGIVTLFLFLVSEYPFLMTMASVTPFVVPLVILHVAAQWLLYVFDETVERCCDQLRFHPNLENSELQFRTFAKNNRPVVSFGFSQLGLQNLGSSIMNALTYLVILAQFYGSENTSPKLK